MLLKSKLIKKIKIRRKIEENVCLCSIAVGSELRSTRNHWKIISRREIYNLKSESEFANLISSFQFVFSFTCLFFFLSFFLFWPSQFKTRKQNKTQQIIIMLNLLISSSSSSLFTYYSTQLSNSHAKSSQFE